MRFEEMIDQIICGDAIEIMQQIPDESIDLVFTDPPFNIGKNYGSGYNDNRQDYQKWTKNWIIECFRILKNDGSFYLMNYINNINWVFLILDNVGIFKNLIIWKHGSAGTSNYFSIYQPIFYYSKSDKMKFNRNVDYQIKSSIGALTSTSKNPHAKWKSVSNIWDDIPYLSAGAMKNKESILISGTNKKVHPCQMPISLPERAIKFSSNKGDIVLDPFIGIGATAIASKRLNRKFIGIDLNQDYCDMAIKRIANIPERLDKFCEKEKLEVIESDPES